MNRSGSQRHGLWARFSGRARDNARVVQVAGNYHEAPSLSEPTMFAGKVWNVSRPVATFAARDADLATLTSHLTGTGAGPLVLHGIPGVGKTQLALAWAHQYADQYSIAWQIRAADRLTAVADLAHLADRLDLVRDPDQEAAAHAAVEYLSGRSEWLLIFDDASAASVRGLLPHRGGQVLLTSRSPNWQPIAATQEVGLFAPQAAAAFLQPGQASPSVAAVRLAEQLGYLPLALEQARAYCVTTGRTLDGYLADYRHQQLLQHGIDESLHAPVTTTIALALAQAERTDPAAAELMLLCAQLAPTPIPRDLVTAAPEVLPEPLKQVVTGASAELDQRVALLSNLALISVGLDGQPRVHQLVGELLRDQPPAAPRRRWWRWRDRPSVPARRWANVAAQLLDAALPDDSADPAYWNRFALLLPHATAIIQRIPQPGAVTIARLHKSCGDYLHQRGEYQAARHHLEQALNTFGRELGEEHLDTLDAMKSLAGVLYEQDELVEARTLCEWLLDVHPRVSGPEAPETVGSMHNLAVVVQGQGDMATARPLFEQVVAAARRMLGEENPRTLGAMTNLAGVLESQGELTAARQMYEQALEAVRRVLGDEHPQTLNTVNNLALLLSVQGEFVAARDLFEQVVEIRQRVLGEEHPRTLRAISHLAAVLVDQGDLATARQQFERVLPVCQRVLGEEHPDTLRAIQDLADLVRRIEAADTDSMG